MLSSSYFSGFLGFNDFLVHARGFQQLGVGAAGDNPSFIDDQNLIGILDGGHALGHDDGGHGLAALGKGLVHGGAHIGICDHIQRGKGIIKEINAWLGHEHAGDG